MPNRTRVLAIAVFRAGDRILLARGVDPASGEAFHRPLGGGVEFGELTEELGAAIEEPRLLDVLENRFEYARRPRHEIVFVFDARFSDVSLYDRAALPVIEAGAGWEDARWISLQALDDFERITPEGPLPLLRADIRPMIPGNGRFPGRACAVHDVHLYAAGPRRGYFHGTPADVSLPRPLHHPSRSVPRTTGRGGGGHRRTRPDRI